MMRALLMAALAATLTACFDGDFTRGRPCSGDEDCGIDLSCEQGFCGGFECPIAVAEGEACPCTSDIDWDCTGMREGISRQIDVLFIVDNSSDGGGLTRQSKLLGVVDDLFDVLEGSLVSYRVGVTTTDNGNPWCPTTPEQGGLVATSCRQRLADFTFNGDPPLEIESVCTDLCAHDTIELGPTTVSGEATQRVRPWIEGDPSGTNVLEIPAREAFTCLLPQGINGCAFEQPLGATEGALSRSLDPEDPQFGFLRESAHLMVFIFTSENDCSYLDQQIFFPGSTFFNDPMDSFPTSAVCWKAGVSCGDGPGPYACEAADKGLDGGPTASSEDAVLYPTSHYVELLESLRATKRARDQSLRVVVNLVAGVPLGYPDMPLVFQDSPDPEFQARFGVAPGCVGEDVEAIPPVRMLEVAAPFTAEGAPNVFSVCEENYGPAFASITDSLTENIDRLCMESCVYDTSPTQPGVQPVCEIRASLDGELREIPHCGLSDGAPSRAENVERCYFERVGDQVPAECTEQGWNLQFGLLEADDAAPLGEVFASCLRSVQPEIDCPR